MKEDAGLKKYWETLTIKKGYKLLINMGVKKSKARIEAVKGVRVYVISAKNK